MTAAWCGLLADSCNVSGRPHCLSVTYISGVDVKMSIGDGVSGNFWENFPVILVEGR